MLFDVSAVRIVKSSSVVNVVVTVSVSVTVCGSRSAKIGPWCIGGGGGGGTGTANGNAASSSADPGASDQIDSSEEKCAGGGYGGVGGGINCFLASCRERLRAFLADLRASVCGACSSWTRCATSLARTSKLCTFSRVSADTWGERRDNSLTRYVADNSATIWASP